MRPAIGTGVRFLCGLVALLSFALAITSPPGPYGVAALVFFGIGVLFALPALFAGHTPAQEFAESATRRLRTFGALRFGLAAAAYIAFALRFAAERLDFLAFLKPLGSQLLVLAGVLFFGAFVLSFFGAYYAYYTKPPEPTDAT